MSTGELGRSQPAAAADHAPSGTDDTLDVEEREAYIGQGDGEMEGEVLADLEGEGATWAATRSPKLPARPQDSSYDIILY